MTRWLCLLAGVALLLLLWRWPWWLLLGALPASAVGPTVPGPEATDLLPRLEGAIYHTADGHVDAIRLPELEGRRIASASPDTATVFPMVHSVSDPDRSGRVALVENRSGESATHALLIADGSVRPPRTLFVRPGDALWEHVIGEHLALTPGGERAYIRDARGTQFPGAYLTQGTLEVLDTRTGRPIAGGVTALDEGLCWFPDGRRLAYVEPVPAPEAPAVSRREGGFGSGFAGWERLPVVQVLDIRSGQVRKLHVGWRPRVSTDGRKVLVEDMVVDTGSGYVSQWRLVDLESGRAEPVTVPGRVGRALALWPDGTVLYWGLPTAGTKLRNPRFNSPLVGPKLVLTLKVGVLNTARFQTVLLHRPASGCDVGSGAAMMGVPATGGPDCTAPPAERW